MTLTEKISSLTDLELAELWDLNHSLKFKIDLLKKNNAKLNNVYAKTESVIFRNQHKEIIEAMRAEIVKRYLEMITH